MTGEEALEHGERPLFEGFGEEGVVGVSDGALCDIPSAIPREFFLIDEEALKLGDGDGGMGIIELDGDFIGEEVEVVGVFFFEASEDILDGAACEEVLLFESKLSTFGGIIFGVKNLGDAFAECFLFDSAAIIACVEESEVEL